MPLPESTEDVVMASLKESFPDDTDLNPQPAADEPVDDEPAAESTDDPASDAPGDGDETIADDQPADDKTGDDEDEPDLDETEKELATFGIQRPKKGQDNRLPYSRMKKIFENARKKLQEAHAKELATRDGRLKEFEGQAVSWKTLSDLARTDAEGFLSAIAAMNPQFREFKRQQAQQADPSKDDPKPLPDVKLQDGTVTYSQDQWERYNEWRDRQVEKRLRAEFENRTKPYEEDRRTREAARANEERLSFMRQQIAIAEEQWGKELITQHQDAIRQMINDNPSISFHAAVTKVLLPLERAGKLEQTDKARAKALKELNEAPAGSTARPGSRKPAAKPVEQMTTAEVVEQAIREAGLIE